MENERTLITSALPYANGSIHIGHLVEYIQTDIIVRFLKLMGKNAIYVCADDTHGTPIEINAMKQGIKPEELIERYHKEHQEDFKSYSIEFDSYYSTNSPENKEFADYIFNKLKEKGLIYTKEVESFYDEKAKRFLPDRFVKGECPKCGAKDQYGDVCEKCNATYKPTDLINPYSTITKTRPIRKKSKHYFFKLSSLSEKLDNWLVNNKNLQKEIRNYVRNWIKEGLQDWDISRDGPYFGFKIPGEEDKYYYVWLDAPVGYISSTANYCKSHNCSVDDYWRNDNSKIVHVIGKDIMYFHLLFWPAMLMESGFNLPDNILVHGFLKVNGEKMSKSRGTFLTAREMKDIIEPEQLRYYYASNLTRSVVDIDLSFGDFKKEINNELIANVFNFIYRTLSFTHKNFNGKINGYDEDIIKKAQEIIERIKSKYGSYELREVVKEILKLSSLGNRYFQENEPWKLIKKDKDKAHKVLSTCVSLAKFITVALKPIMPKHMQKIEEQLNLKNLTFNDIVPFEEHSINEPEIIIKKIDDIKLKTNKEESKMEDKKAASFDMLNLKVAKILSVEDHPNADKLYVMKIDIGEERQLVAGLKAYYSKEELLGKNIVVVYNMKPAKLRGYESQGMLLAGDHEGKVKVLEAKNSEPGDQVYIGGVDVADPENKVTIDVILDLGLKCKNKKAVWNDKVLKTDKENIFVDLDEGKIR